MTWLRPLRAASLFCALGLSSFRAEAGFSQGLTATLEPPEITIEDHAVLSVTVQGAGAEQPTMPPLPDFESRYIGQSSRLEWINGRGSRQVTYRWQIIPRAVGEFTIGSARVSIRGEVHESLPLPVRVLPAASRPSEPRGVFVTASVSNSRPYVGEQILYTWRFYYAVNVHQPQLEPLVFEPFLVEDLGRGTPVLDHLRRYALQGLGTAQGALRPAGRGPHPAFFPPRCGGRRARGAASQQEPLRRLLYPCTDRDQGAENRPDRDRCAATARCAAGFLGADRELRGCDGVCRRPSSRSGTL